VSFSFGTYVYAETPEEAQTESGPQTETESPEEEIQVSNGDGYGTEFEGIYTTKINNYTKIPATESFYNGSFSQGLRYWARTGDGYTSALATLMAVSVMVPLAVAMWWKARQNLRDKRKLESQTARLMTGEVSR
jgi:hypothetical protein